MNFLKKDFKQKYFLYCEDCKFFIKKFADIENKPHICRIKITDIE